MIKSIFIICTAVTTFGFTTYGYLNWNKDHLTNEEFSYNEAMAYNEAVLSTFYPTTDPELVYKVDQRFNTTITKEKLDNATSIIDILPKNAIQPGTAYHNVRVTILKDDHDIMEIGQSEFLNVAQKTLLQSADYSTNFRVSAICKKKDNTTGTLRIDSLVYYLTVIPAKEATFLDGHDELIQYLRENSKEEIAVIKKDKLQPGKFRFTVTKNGTIADVKLEYTSGYPDVDETLIELVGSMPEKWEPAMNAKGEKVDQELVFFFGLEGC